VEEQDSQLISYTQLADSEGVAILMRRRRSQTTAVQARGRVMPKPNGLMVLILESEAGIRRGRTGGENGEGERVCSTRPLYY
jgi:hypothetical protein